MGGTEGISSGASRSGFEVLWAGEMPVAEDSMRALRERGAQVRIISVEACVEEVSARAPDLLVLCGTACAGLEAFFRNLREREPFAWVPVALIGADRPVDPTGATPRLRRTGVVAQLSAELGSEALASELRALLRALSARRARWADGVLWDELDGWLDLTASAGGCGFLMTSEPTAAIVLGPDGQRAPSVRMLKQARRAKGPRTARFVDFPAGRLMVLRQPGPETGSAQLQGMRVLLVHPVPERRAALGEALSVAGAELHAIGQDVDALASAASFEPTLIVVSALSLIGSKAESLWRDERVASCSWVVLDETSPKPLTPAYVAQAASALGERRRSLLAQLERGELVVGRIESLRAAGWISVFSGARGAWSVVLEGAAGCAELELQDGAVAAVRFRKGPEQPFADGDRALESLRALTAGRVLAGPAVAVSSRRAELAVPLPDAALNDTPPQSAASSPGAHTAAAPFRALAPRTGDPRATERSRLRKYVKLAGALSVCIVLVTMAWCDPSSPLGKEDALRFEQAKRDLADANYAQAQPVLAELVLRHPADFQLRYDLALSLLKLERPREARVELEKAKALDPDASQVWFLLGESYLEEKNLPEALQAWKHCLEVRRGYMPCEERLSTWGQ